MSSSGTLHSTPANEVTNAELVERLHQSEETIKSMRAALAELQSLYTATATRLALVEHCVMAMDYAPIPSTSTTSANGTGPVTASSAAASASPDATTAPTTAPLSSAAAAANTANKPHRESSNANRQLEEELQRLGLTPATSGFAAAAQNDPASLVFEQQTPSQQQQQQQQPSLSSSPLHMPQSQAPMSGPFMPTMLAQPTTTGSPSMGTSPHAMMPMDGIFTGSPMTAQPPSMFPRVAVPPGANPMFADPYFMAGCVQQQQQRQQISPSNMPLNTFGMMPMGGGGGTGAGPNSANTHASGSGASPVASVVVIEPSRASNEVLDRVCQQTQYQYVKDLCLRGCKAITNFTPLSRLRNLWKLNLQGCSQSVDDSVVKLIGSCNSRISRLNLCGCERVTDASALAQLAYLFDLNLSGCQIGNASLQAISTGCSQLSRLAINSCPLVTSIACCGNLKELKLLYCRYSANITPASITSVLVTIGQNLLTLNVDGVKFDTLDLSQIPTGTALKNFNLKDNSALVDLTWLTSVKDASRLFASLETLDMEGCEHLTRLGDLSQLPSLKTLRLSSTAVTLEELQRIAQNPALHLHTLYVDGCAALTDLSCLVAMRTLAKLVIDNSTQGTSARALPAAVSGQLELVLAQPNHGSGSPTSAHAPNGRSPTTHGPGMLGANSSLTGATGFIGGPSQHHLNPNSVNSLAVGSGYFGGMANPMGSHGYVSPNSISPFTSPTVFTVPPMPTIDQATAH